MKRASAIGMLLFMVACGSSSSGNGTGNANNGAGTSTGGGDNAGGGTGTTTASTGPCESPLPEESKVEQTKIAEEPPQITPGGSLDGTWKLTAWNCYTGDGGATGTTGLKQSETYEFNGTKYYNGFYNAADELSGASGTVDIDSANGGFQRQQECPSAKGFPTDKYGMLGNDLAIEGSGCEGGKADYLIYTKQP